MKKITINLLSLLFIILPSITMAQVQLQPSELPNWRPYDQKGVNVFEAPKDSSGVSNFNGVAVRIGAGFAQNFQALKHENTPFKDATGKVTNPLYRLDAGFGIAQANLMLDMVLADGIMLHVNTYLSSRHHNEAWVKGGYMQFDKLPFKGEVWDNLMKNIRVKVGHMEVNYGDGHFRRTDGGHALYNPFIENYVLDDFATEVAAEVYYMRNGFTAMGALSNGLINGGFQNSVLSDGSEWKRSPSVYAKLAYDNITPSLDNSALRYRLSGSVYHNNSSGRSTLFAGDRTGSNYFFVMESPTATAKDNAFSGRVNGLNFSQQVTAMQVNGLLKFKPMDMIALELFGTYETGKGRTSAEKLANFDKRDISQFAVDGIIRLGAAEKLFGGIRYNKVKGNMIPSNTAEQSIDRFAIGGGWFVTPNILAKAEYVNQKYNDYPTNNINSGGKFHGVVIQAAVGF